MSETMDREKKFIMNEYLEVTIKGNLVPLCSDCYRALGWTIVDTGAGVDAIKIKLQRDRKMKHRVALCDLQRKCEMAFQAIERLENSKTTKAFAVALGVGLLGTGFMAGSVFAYLASLIPLSIILAIPGFLGWGLPYLLYREVIIKSTERINPLIDEKYDIIYEACEKASQLLS
jgi:hypothetical protein